MSAAVTRATFEIGEADLPRLVLVEDNLPPRYQDFQALREGGLDNRTMAEHGFAGATEERFRRAGRVAGFLREFGLPGPQVYVDGVDFVVASVAHLFDSPESVHRWMLDVFIRDFEDNVGVDLGDGQVLQGIDHLTPKGFFDEAVGLRTIHDNSGQTVSSTVIDFRVGRILGVVFVATLGDHHRLEEASELGISMERLIVSVALGH